MKRSIITIAGAIGSGKSSTAKRVAAELRYRHFSSGDLFRAIAKERGFTIEQINTRAELELEIDYAIDERLKRLYSESDLVIDSRLAYHWMPESYKVYLTIDPLTAAERIYHGIKSDGRVSQDAESIDHVLEASALRLASEKKRYLSLYSIDIDDHSAFDLVIDTGTTDLESVVQNVLGAYHAWLHI